MKMSSLPGTYALLLRLREQTPICVGAQGEIVFPQGYYVYVGSAFGPGGVRRRVAHHLAPPRNLIGTLTTSAAP